MARKKKETYAVEGPLWDIEGTPWGAEAAYRAEDEGVPLEEARDAVILRYLNRCGDTRPLQALLALGICPGPNVLQFLSAMLAAEPSGALRYRLKAHGIAGEKVRDGEILWRNFIIARRVKEMIDTGDKYDVAIREVADEMGLSLETIREIYDGGMRIARERLSKGD